MSEVKPAHDGWAFSSSIEDGGDNFSASRAARGKEGVPRAADTLAGQKCQFNLRGKSEIKL
jgi:hypothetical protein